MTELKITIHIEAPEIVEAIKGLSGLIQAPAGRDQTWKADEPVEHPTVSATVPSPAEPVAESPKEEPSKKITLEDITNAGSELLDAGKLPELMELLSGFNVQTVVQLKPEQFAEVANGLRKLGAHI